MTRLKSIRGVFVGFIAALTLSACGGLGGEPEIVSTLPPAPTGIPAAIISDHPGAVVYAEHCASCHGETGQGDGAVTRNAGVPVPDFTDPATQAAVPYIEWERIIREGLIEQGKLMPPWQNSLTEQQILDVSEFTYALSEGNIRVADESTAEATGEAAAQAAGLTQAAGSISGAVMNGTRNAPVDQALDVTLHILDGTLQEVNTVTTSAQDGLYTFEGVQIRSDQAYVVSTRYNNVAFYSNFFLGTPDQPQMDVPLEVYELTADPSVVAISLLLTRITQYSDAIVFELVVNFQNDSDHAYLSDTQIGADTYASVSVTLPPFAEVLNTADLTGRFVNEVDGVTGALRVIDTDPVTPGEVHSVQIFYALPLSPTADEESFEISFPVEYEMVNDAELMIRPGGITVESDQFEDMGLQQFNSGTYNSYLASLLTIGDTLVYTVKVQDNPTAATSSDAGGSDGQQSLALVLLFSGAGLMALSAVLWIVSRRKNAI